GRPIAMNYTPTRDPVNAFKAAIQMAYAEVPPSGPRDTPVMLGIVCVMPRPGKPLKTKPNPAYWHAKRPDIDNICKAIKDALSGIAYVDDALVAVVSSLKVVGKPEWTPGAMIRIGTLRQF